MPTESSVNRVDELAEVGPAQGIIRGPIAAAASIWRHRRLLVLLVQREIKARYKDSGLGLLWGLLRPLTMLLIYYFAIGQFLGAARMIPEFAIFVFTGLTAWTLFSEILTSTTTSIVANAGLVKKVYVPREVFPLSGVGVSLFNFAIQFVILLAATILTGQAPLSVHWWTVPAAAIVLVVFASALGLLLAGLNVYLRDVQHLVEIFLLVFFWASPIVYSYGMVSESSVPDWLKEAYAWNPITIIVMNFQRGMWVAGADQPWPAFLELRLLVVFVVGLLLAWVAQRVFARLEGSFAQEL